MLGAKTPTALKDILVEGIAAEPTDWGSRMESIRSLARIDHGLARREAEAVLAIPATLTQPGAQFDAVAALAGIAREEKHTPRACLAAGDRPAALRVAGYLYNQPNEGEPGHVTNLSSLKVELERGGTVELKKETSPWDFALPTSGRRTSKSD